MIRVVAVDDHHAVRLGLLAALSTEPDMDFLGAVSTAAELAPLIYRTNPHVVVVDYRLPDVDGLTLCRRLKHEIGAPRVVLHSAFADDMLTLPAVLAGVDAIVPKGAPGRELAQAVRTVAAGGTIMPPVDHEVLRSRAEVLEPEDHPILGLMVHGTPAQDIAAVLRLEPEELRTRLDRMLATMRARPPAGD